MRHLPKPRYLRSVQSSFLNIERAQPRSGDDHYPNLITVVLVHSAVAAYPHAKRPDNSGHRLLRLGPVLPVGLASRQACAHGDKVPKPTASCRPGWLAAPARSRCGE